MTTPTTTQTGTRTASWAEFEADAPELAARVRERFLARKHCTLATLRADGAPRISGTELELSDGELWIGSMPGAVKARDLQRDGRCGLHSATVDPVAEDGSDWPGEAKVHGVAEEVGAVPGHPPTSHRFRIALTEAVFTRVVDGALAITSWHPGRGVEEHRRS